MNFCPQGSDQWTCHFYKNQYDIAPVFFNQDLDLPSFGAEDFSVTISGFGTGSTLALTTGVIYSSQIYGLGLFNGASYADNNENKTQDFYEQSVKAALFQESTGQIDPLFNLIQTPVFIHSSEEDEDFTYIKQINQQKFALRWGSVVQMAVDGFAHILPVSDKIPCVQPGQLQFQTCGYDTVGEMLKFLLSNLEQGKITSWQPMDFDWKNKGVLREFSQTSFVESMIHEFDGIDEIGYIYYPNQCAQGNISCKLHIYLHDCEQQVNYISSGGLEAITSTGFLEYATSNNLIVVFPQATFSVRYNPNSCWDVQQKHFLDRKHEDYFNYKSLQPKFLMNIIKRVTSPINKQRYRYFSSNLLQQNQYQSWVVQTLRFLKNIPDLLTWTFINDKENPSPSYFYEVRHFIFDLLGIQIDHRNEEEEH